MLVPSPGEETWEEGWLEDSAASCPQAVKAASGSTVASSRAVILDFAREICIDITIAFLKRIA